MIGRLRAFLVALALGSALVGCGGWPSPAHGRPIVGTCVTRSVGASSETVTVVPCEGPHTHVISAFLPGVHEVGPQDNPCPVGSDLAELAADGVMCLHPVSSTSS